MPVKGSSRGLCSYGPHMPSCALLAGRKTRCRGEIYHRSTAGCRYTCPGPSRGSRSFDLDRFYGTVPNSEGSLDCYSRLLPIIVLSHYQDITLTTSSEPSDAELVGDVERGTFRPHTHAHTFICINTRPRADKDPARILRSLAFVEGNLTQRDGWRDGERREIKAKQGGARAHAATYQYRIHEVELPKKTYPVTVG